MEKFTVMLVDDDKLAIEDLEEMIDWEALGFIIVAKAYNGKQAFGYFMDQKPDLVITDIRMPLEDGIDLARNIRSVNSDTKILMVSSYSDFEYAKNAIPYQIADYLIKSEITKESVAKRLEKLIEEMRAGEQDRQLMYDKAVSECFAAVNESEEETFYSRLIDTLKKGTFCFFIIEHDLPLPVDRKERHAPQKSMSRINDICMKACGENIQIEVLSRLLTGRILVMGKMMENVISGKEFFSVMRTVASQIRGKYRENFGCSCSVFYSAKRCSLTEIRNRYQKINEIIKGRYLSVGTGVFDLDDNELEIKDTGIVPKESLVKEWLELGQYEKLEEYIDKAYDEISKNHDYHALVKVTQFFHERLQKQIYTLPYNDELEELEDLLRCEACWYNAGDIKNWLKRIDTEFTKAKIAVLSNKYPAAVVNMIEYINKNYKESQLSVSEIADHVSLSPARVSVIFKENTGKTINNFIKEVRMERAKKLLKNTNLKIYEIAESIGYTTSQYFSQIFLFYTGEKPLEYRNNGTEK